MRFRDAESSSLSRATMDIEVFDERVELPLAGILEWIASQGGTVKQFNEFVFLGEIKGIKYRYFVSEKWIGLKLEGCPAGKMVAFETTDGFIQAIEEATEETTDWPQEGF